MKKILQNAIRNNQKALSEYESKLVIHEAGIAITTEYLAQTREEAVARASAMGYPVVLKGCSHTLMHKTETGMVMLNLSSDEDVARAYDDIINRSPSLEGVLVQEMIKGNREFVIGMTRDPNFGPCIMFGLGGIFTEVLKDISFRIAPLTHDDALEMISELKTRELLDEFRGSPAVDKEALAQALVGLGNLACEHDEIAEIDINPLIIAGNRPVAVDALVILKNGKTRD